jgi:[acyl-carrier-protein] S-malonyltransferase
MALPLKVSGGFHSPFMADAAVRFAKVLAATDFAAPRLPVYANRTGMPYEGPVAKTLSEQMDHPVLWEKTIRQMSADGFDTFVETGVGNVLSKLIAKILPGASVYTASEPEVCEKVAGEVLGHA